MQQVRFRWFVVCLAVLAFAASAHADPTLTADPSTWWSWLMSRIGVPGG